MVLGGYKAAVKRVKHVVAMLFGTNNTANARITQYSGAFLQPLL